MAIHSCPPHSSCSDACFWRSSNWRVPREHHWGCWRAASHWIKRTCVLDQTWIMHYFEWFLWTECIIHERQPTMVLLPWYFFLFYSRNVTVNLIYHYKFKPTVLYIQSNNGTINLNLLVMQRATHNYYWHCIDIHFPTSYRYHLYFWYEVHVYELISNVNENILNSFCSCNNPIKLWLMNE